MATPPKKPTDGTKPPAPRKPATPRKTTTRKAAAPAPAKSAVRKISKPRTAPAPASPAAATPPAVAVAAPKASPAKPATPKPAAKRAPATASRTAGTGTGRRWGIAAAVGGVGAALTAGLLALRGSTPKVSDDVAVPKKGKKAHQADGTDSSASFEAGIADEGTIPE